MNTPHVSKLMLSMQKYGYIPSIPITVYRAPDGSLIIIDGHHRHAAAIALGIKFYYVIVSDSFKEAMRLFNETRKSWCPISTVEEYAAKGKPEYEKLLRHFKSSGLPIMTVAVLLNSNLRAKEVRENLREGAYKIKSDHYLRIVSSMMEEHATRKAVLRSSQFVNAFTKCLLLPEFDVAQFRKNLAECPGILEKKANETQMLQLIECIFNKRSRKPFPLAFMVRQNSSR